MKKKTKLSNKNQCSLCENIVCRNTSLCEKLQNVKLRPSAMIVLRHIKLICENSRDGSCFKSIKNIAKDCGLCIQTAFQGKRQLQNLGLVEIQEFRNGRRRNPRHKITIPGAVELPKVEPRISIRKKKVRLDFDFPKKFSSRLKKKTAIVERILGEDFDSYSSHINKFSSINNRQRLDYIDLYLSVGWLICPAYYPIFEGGNVRCSCRDRHTCKVIGKHPLHKRKTWREKFSKLGKDGILKYFADRPQYNIGVWLPHNINVVDCDDLTRVDFFWKDGYDSLTSKTGRGVQVFYQANQMFGTSTSRLALNIDTKKEKDWIILPPSQHKSGNFYDWLVLKVPVQLPDFFVDLWQETSKRIGTKSKVRNPITKIANEVLSRNASKYSITESSMDVFRLPQTLPTFIIKQGVNVPNSITNSHATYAFGRNNHLYSYGRRLRAWGVSHDNIKSTLAFLNKTKCVPPVDDNEMARLLQSILYGENSADWVERGIDR